VDEVREWVDRDFQARWEKLAAKPRCLSHRATERPIHLTRFNHTHGIRHAELGTVAFKKPQSSQAAKKVKFP